MFFNNSDIPEPVLAADPAGLKEGKIGAPNDSVR
jgi:hypothetical protein